MQTTKSENILSGNVIASKRGHLVRINNKIDTYKKRLDEIKREITNIGRKVEQILLTTHAEEQIPPQFPPEMQKRVEDLQVEALFILKKAQEMLGK